MHFGLVSTRIWLLLLLLLKLFKVGQIYNSANVFTIQYIITKQNRLTKKINSLKSIIYTRKKYFKF